MIQDGTNWLWWFTESRNKLCDCQLGETVILMPVLEEGWGGGGEEVGSGGSSEKRKEEQKKVQRRKRGRINNSK